MTRSYKKPYEWISKRSERHDKKALRRTIKQACHEAEIDFDPDRDFEELHAKDKEFGDYGTKMGFDMPPLDGDSTWMHESYEKIKRK